jgi:ribosome-associated protein
LREGLEITPGVSVPASAIDVSAARSGGPGGQNVNKVASKVLLRVDLGRILGLTPDARERLLALAGNRLDADGRLLVTSQRYRDQPRNLEDARQKLRALVARALVRPEPRRPTRTTAAGRERRLERKRRDALKKRRRRGAPEDF